MRKSAEQHPQIVSHPDKQAHDRQVIQEEKKQRLLKIKKSKLDLPQQISPYIPPEEGANTEDGNLRPRRTENDNFAVRSLPER